LGKLGCLETKVENSQALKQPSLLQKSVNYGAVNFYSTGPWVDQHFALIVNTNSSSSFSAFYVGGVTDEIEPLVPFFVTS
jgi:hypothetical protein